MIKDEWYAQNLTAALSLLPSGAQVSAYLELEGYYSGKIVSSEPCIQISDGSMVDPESTRLVVQDFMLHYRDKEQEMEMNPRDVPSGIAEKVRQTIVVATVAIVLAIILSCFVLMIAAS